MPKRVKKSRRKRTLSKDVNQRAAALVALTTGEPTDFRGQLSEYMRQLGKKGGRKSGRTRKDWLPLEDRRRVASIAAKARWKKAREKEKKDSSS
jgi:hypothetical protein